MDELIRNETIFLPTTQDYLTMLALVGAVVGLVFVLWLCCEMWGARKR